MAVAPDGRPLHAMVLCAVPADHLLNGLRVVRAVELDLIQALEDHVMLLLARLACCCLVELLGSRRATLLGVDSEKLGRTPTVIRMVDLYYLFLAVILLPFRSVPVATALGGDKAHLTAIVELIVRHRYVVHASIEIAIIYSPIASWVIAGRARSRRWVCHGRRLACKRGRLLLIKAAPRSRRLVPVFDLHHLIVLPCHIHVFKLINPIRTPSSQLLLAPLTIALELHLAKLRLILGYLLLDALQLRLADAPAYMLAGAWAL